MKRIILSGIKHSGKSTVGWALASQLGLYFADLDDLILRDADGFDSVRDIYRIQANEGKDFVLSLGGGTIENQAALELLNREDVSTYYLDADEKALFNRIARGGIPPFLEGENPKEKFGILYEKRSELYRNWASVIIDTRGKTPAKITEEIAVKISQT